ncbi:thiamine phosphate synthase [Sphingobacterium deserti]|uniref:Thiamine-phosphate diphosphorylase n=1 Tax=Sphingobacterium deserti TaxID=1229276 RepID=A0A0B8T2M8_9SPHI|nr:thiamine phosphate synthase [Sphingobacterium deserti]KGE13128.1 thiamine-phosphate diphosphorylase [Sphingobacterium deserti]
MRIITSPHPQNQEISILRQLLAWPGVYVHVRKPALSETDYIKFLCAFSVEERAKLIAHQAHFRAMECGLSRLHFSTSMRETAAIPDTANKKYISTSTHGWIEFNGLPCLYDAAFVSPLFPSISKQGYGEQNRIALIGRRNLASEAIALGGISSTRLATMSAHNFDDFAVCGAIWEAQDPIGEARSCLKLSKQFTDIRAQIDPSP